MNQMYQVFNTDGQVESRLDLSGTQSNGPDGFEVLCKSDRFRQKLLSPLQKTYLKKKEVTAG